jgi:hypothetical protein
MSITDRICFLRVKGKWFSCTLINVHALTGEKTEEVNEELYTLLE